MIEQGETVYFGPLAPMVHVINGSCVKSSIVRLPAGLKVGLAAHFVTTFGQQKNYQIMERGIGRFPPLSLLNQA